MNSVDKLREDILTEITDFCRTCPSNDSCSEDECVLYRIEQKCIKPKKKEGINVKTKKDYKLEWYAFRYDWNKHDLERTNVLNNTVIEYLIKRIKREKLTTYDEIKEGLSRELKYYFMSKAEHEVLVSDLFPKDYEDFCNQAVKIDVWYQLEPNLDRMVEYVISKLNINIE